MDRLGGRPHEQQPRFLLAVVVIQRHVDLDRLVAQGAEVLERALVRGVKAAADLSGPADEQHQLLIIEAQPGLLGLDALRVGE